MRPHPEQNIQHQIIILILVRIKDFLCNFCTAAPGVHGALFNVAVGGILAHLLPLHQTAFCMADQPYLCDLFLYPRVFLPEQLQAAVVAPLTCGMRTSWLRFWRLQLT